MVLSSWSICFFSTACRCGSLPSSRSDGGGRAPASTLSTSARLPPTSAGQGMPSSSSPLTPRKGQFAVRAQGRVRSFAGHRIDEPVQLELPLGRSPPQGAIMDALALVRDPPGPSHGFDERTWLRLPRRARGAQAGRVATGRHARRRLAGLADASALGSSVRSRPGWRRAARSSSGSFSATTPLLSDGCGGRTFARRGCTTSSPSRAKTWCSSPRVYFRARVAPPGRWPLGGRGRGARSNRRYVLAVGPSPR